MAAIVAVVLLGGCGDAGVVASTTSGAPDGSSTDLPISTATSPTTAMTPGTEGTAANSTLPDTGDGATASESEATVDGITAGGTTTGVETTGDGTTGDGTTGDEETCPSFTSISDDRFDSLLASLQAAVSPLSTDPRPSGLAVAVVVDGELRHAGGVGTRAKARHPLAAEPVGAGTLFWTASTSKWVNGAMISTLVEEGLLEFDAPVTDVLPDYTETNGLQDAITLHHLLRMISGLGDANPCWLFSVSKSSKPSRCAIFSEGPGTVLEQLFDPGTFAIPNYAAFNTTQYGAPGIAPFQYSNLGIMLSGRVAEVAGGSPYPELVAKRIFTPAQMCSATYDAADMLSSGDYAVGSGSDGVDGVCVAPELGHDSLAPWEPDELACRARDPNGGVRASAVDLGRFAAAFLADLRGENILMGEDAAHRMLCPEGGRYDQACLGRVTTNGYAGSDTYGYTNFHQTTNGHDVYTHGGSRPGYGALFWLVPAHDFAVVILGNTSDTAFKAAPQADFAVDCWLNGKC